jgi:hypothetical protein
MKITRCVVAAIGVCLCLCTIAKGDDDQIPGTGNARRPVVVKRIIVVRTYGDRMILVKPAYPATHAYLPVKRSWYSNTVSQGHRRNVVASDSGDADNPGAKVIKTRHSPDTNQSQLEADKDSKSAGRKPAPDQAESKQTQAKEPEANQSEDAGALDRLAVQAQKEQAVLPAEPGGVGPK